MKNRMAAATRATPTTTPITMPTIAPVLKDLDPLPEDFALMLAAEVDDGVAATTLVAVT